MSEIHRIVRTDMSSRANIYGKEFSTGLRKMKQPTPYRFYIRCFSYSESK